MIPPERIPDHVFRGNFRCGAVEFNLLVIILNETCRPGAREWTRLSDEQLAGWSGLTHPTFIDFRRRLAKRGLIEFKPAFGITSCGSSEYRPANAVLGLIDESNVSDSTVAKGAA